MNQYAVVNKFRCPECGSKTVTFRWPSKFAGIWECLNDACGASDVCEHVAVHEEMIEPRPTSPYDNPIAAPAYVCDLCNVTLEEPDPIMDRMEAAYE